MPIHLPDEQYNAIQRDFLATAERLHAVGCDFQLSQPFYTAFGAFGQTFTPTSPAVACISNVDEWNLCLADLLRCAERLERQAVAQAKRPSVADALRAAAADLGAIRARLIDEQSVI